MPTHVLGVWAALVRLVPRWDKGDRPCSPTWFLCFSVYCSHSGDGERLWNQNLECKLMVCPKGEGMNEKELRRSFPMAREPKECSLSLLFVLGIHYEIKWMLSHRCRWLDRNKCHCSSVQGIKWVSKCPGEHCHSRKKWVLNQQRKTASRCTYTANVYVWISRSANCSLAPPPIILGFWEHILYPGAFAVASGFSLACKQSIPLGLPRVLTTFPPWMV